MSKRSEKLEMASELAKLASLLAPGIEDQIGAHINSGEKVQDNIDINKTYSWYRQQYLPQQHGAEIPEDEFYTPSIEEATSDAMNVYGDQTHNSDFYPKTVDQKVQELYSGGSAPRQPMIARKAMQNKVSKKASRKNVDSKLLKVAQDLIKLASQLHPGIEDTIGEHKNSGTFIQDNLDSNKGLHWYKKQYLSHEDGVTTYTGNAANFTPEMDTGKTLDEFMPVVARKAMLNNIRTQNPKLAMVICANCGNNCGSGNCCGNCSCNKGNKVARKSLERKINKKSDLDLSKDYSKVKNIGKSRKRVDNLSSDFSKSLGKNWAEQDISIRRLDKQVGLGKSVKDVGKAVKTPGSQKSRDLLKDVAIGIASDPTKRVKFDNITKKPELKPAPKKESPKKKVISQEAVKAASKKNKKK